MTTRGARCTVMADAKDKDGAVADSAKAALDFRASIVAAAGGVRAAAFCFCFLI